MSRGKYLSLEEARKGETKGATIERFCEEHPSKGSRRKFDQIFRRMAKAKPKEKKTPEK